MFVIQRTDGAFVAHASVMHSYTTKLQDAQTWPTRAAAEAQRCVLNERVLAIEDALRNTPKPA